MGRTVERCGALRAAWRRAALSLALALALQACAGPGASRRNAATAERFFTALYGGEPDVVRALAGEDVVLSYPAFEGALGTPVVRGREEVVRFARRFAQRWSDPSLVVHEVVADEDSVVLLWSFRGRQVDPDGGGAPSGEELSWGGISLLRFDAQGRVVVEVGEESAPGPVARLAAEWAAAR